MTLRIAGKAPEAWIADSGQAEPIAIYTATGDGRTRVPMQLDAHKSAMLVLRQPAGAHLTQASWNGADMPVRLSPNGEVELEARTPGQYTATLNDGTALRGTVPALPAPLALAGSWTVEFTPGWDAPATATFDKLISWTEHAVPGIRYYSGSATYTTRLRLPDRLDASHPLYLDLGDVGEIAAVRLNGQDLGVLWERPFRVALGSAAKAGWNELSVEVTNLWPNRLIGDATLPPEKRLTRTNITKFNAASPLLPSGLLGPVTVESRSTVRMTRVR
ncbi:MAG: glycosylhydrolase-like jelly roll fold domain-containing protein [Ignavibacteriota bacterium]